MPAYKIEAAAVKAPAPASEQDQTSADRALDGVAPRVALENAFRLWWVIVLLMIVGGSAGWMVHRLRPPVYEATGRFSASIDYVATGPLTQFEEDVALNKIGNLILSSLVKEKVIQQAQAEGLQINLSDLSRMAVAERKVNAWELRVRDTDPWLAERVANIWMEQGQAALLESSSHALAAYQLTLVISSLERCLESTAAGEPGLGICSRSRFKEIQEDLQAAGEALAAERAASNGLFSGLLIGPVEQGGVSGNPVQYGRSQLILAGSMIGLVLGIWLVQSGLPVRWSKTSGK